LIIPYVPELGGLFGFEAPPLSFLLILAGLIGAYLVLVEIVKKWYVQRYSYRLEQALVPRREWRKRLSADRQRLYNVSAVSTQHQHC